MAAKKVTAAELVLRARNPYAVAARSRSGGGVHRAGTGPKADRRNSRLAIKRGEY